MLVPPEVGIVSALVFCVAYFLGSLCIAYLWHKHAWRKIEERAILSQPDEDLLVVAFAQLEKQVHQPETVYNASENQRH